MFYRTKKSRTAVIKRQKHRRAFRKMKRERTGEFKGGTVWNLARKAARKDHCEYTGVPFFQEINGKIVRVNREACDHILPRRFISKSGLNPHQKENLACITVQVHAVKTAFEWRLFCGDTLGFISEWKRNNFPVELLARTAKHYGIKEILKLL